MSAFIVIEGLLGRGHLIVSLTGEFFEHGVICCVRELTCDVESLVHFSFVSQFSCLNFLIDLYLLVSNLSRLLLNSCLSFCTRW